MSRVLLVRSDGIGDALACTPLIAALRDAGHTVDAVLSTRNAEVFAPQTFTQVHVLVRIPWPAHGSTPQTIGRVTRAIAASYDIALVASEEPEAYELARLAAPERTGFITGVERPLKTIWARNQLTRVLRRPASLAHVREHEVQTLFRLGERLTPEAFPTRDVARLAPLICDTPPPARNGTIAQLTPKWETVGVPADVLVAVLRGSALRAVASTDEAAFASAVADRASIALTITSDVRAWIAQIDGAHRVFTPDTGAAHLAGMLGIATVVVYPASPHVDRQLVRWQPWTGTTRSVIVADGEASDIVEARLRDALVV